MLEHELETAVAIARKAGEAIRKYYSLEIVTEEKLGIDNFAEPVTIADRTASRIIVDGIAATFPNDAILSEEEADELDDRLAKERVWFIDPIDGTAGFIKKDGDFAVQIGLAEKGVPILGVVFLPARDVLYFAARGNGAFVVEEARPPIRLRVSNETSFANINLAVSKDHRSPKMSRIVKEFGFRREIGRGSVGVKIGMIAEKTCDLYIHLSHRTKFWDTCGPQVILEEAGGKLTDLFGNSLRYDLEDVQNHNGVLASNRAVHEQTVANLRPLLIEFGRLKLTAKGGN